MKPGAVIAALLASVLLYATASRVDGSRMPPTSSMPSREPVVIHEFSGVGKHATRPFVVSDRWEIQWEFTGLRNSVIEVKSAVGEFLGLACNNIGATKGSAYQPRGGEVFLSITGGSWKVKVVQL